MITSPPPPPSTGPAFSDSVWKRFETEDSPSPPVLALDREGAIRSLTRSARRALEYRFDDPVVRCFFSHVHKRNMRRVMRDLADMVSRGRQRARWLLRLRTGNDRWRWYRVRVRNRLREKDARILVHLRPL